MFVKLNRSLPEGKNFKFYDGLIFFNENQNNFQCFDLQEYEKKWELQLIEPNTFYISDFFEGILIVTDGSTTTCFINYDNGVIVRKLDFGIGKVFLDYFLAWEKVDEKYYNALVSVYTGKFLWHSMPIQFFEIIDDEYLMGFPVRNKYGKDSSIIGRYHVESGALLWQYNVAEMARWRSFSGDPERPGVVRKFFGVWQDELLMALSNKIVLSLHIHTGEFKRKWRDIPGFMTKGMSAAIPAPEYMVLDKAGGKLVGAYHTFFWEIDLPTGEIVIKNLSEEFGQHTMIRYSFAGGSDPVLCEDQFITIGKRYHSEKNGDDWEVIALNRKTHAIDWRHTFPMEKCGRFYHLRSPILAGDCLYVQDALGLLHIFERTR